MDTELPLRVLSKSFSNIYKDPNTPNTDNVYLGSAAKAPKDLTTWVLDRDFIDPAKKSLEVRLLINKSQLNDLISALELLLAAVKRSEFTQKQFFDSLQSVVASSTIGEKVTLTR